MRKYILIGFQSKEEAKNRSHEIALERGSAQDSVTKYWFNELRISDDSWALIVPENQIQFLREEEQAPQRLKELHFKKTWQMRTPVLYRYMPQQFIDEFFEHGKLKLSSFSEFAKHKDELRHDSQEGANILTGIGSGQTVFAKTRHGHDAYILCTSVLESHELMNGFGCDGYFRINDSTAFGQAVADALPNSRGGLEGFCSYQDQRVIERQIGNFKLDDLRNEDDTSSIDMGKMHELISEIGGADVYFVKLKLKKYLDQAEYRFVWLLDGTANPEFKLECPKAVQYCERVTG